MDIVKGLTDQVKTKTKKFFHSNQNVVNKSYSCTTEEFVNRKKDKCFMDEVIFVLY